MCFLLISKYCLKNVEVSDNVQNRYIYHFNRFLWPKPMSPSPIPFLCQNYGDQPGNKEIFEFFFTVLMSTASMRTVFYILSFLSLTTKKFGPVDSSRAHEPLEKLLLCFHHLNSCCGWVSPHILFVLSVYFNGYIVVTLMENINGSLACAYEILSSSVDDITNICALHEQTYFILAELQTKENSRIETEHNQES